MSKLSLALEELHGFCGWNATKLNPLYTVRAEIDRLRSALGEVSCSNCGLAVRDAGRGCAQCWDWRATHDETLL